MLSRTNSWRIHQRYADLYRQVAQRLSDDHAALRDEYLQIRLALDWLTKNIGLDTAPSFMTIVDAMASYFLLATTNDDLLSLCRTGFVAAQFLGETPGWLWLLQARAHFAAGGWDDTAVDISRNSDPTTYGRAALVAGQMQLNRGDYTVALKTLANAQALFTEQGDREGSAAALAEVAVYHLNRGEHNKALELYEEADRIRGRTDTQNLTDHSLLMLGVVHRKLGHFDKALGYLKALLARGETENVASSIATASHHIAWVYLDLNQLAEARQAAEQAQTLYAKIKDPRGLSDADEQFGEICLREGNLPGAVHWLKQSVVTRSALSGLRK